MRSICLLQLCRLGVIVYDWLDIPWLKNYYNFGFDHYEMSRRKVGFSGLIDLLLGHTGPFASGDWILPDLTIQGSIKLNSRLRTFPNTFYFSYATKKTRKLFGITVPSSVLGVHPMLFLRVLQMCMWRHPQNAPLPYKGYRWVLCSKVKYIFLKVSACGSLFSTSLIFFADITQGWRLGRQWWGFEHNLHDSPTHSYRASTPFCSGRFWLPSFATWDMVSTMFQSFASTFKLFGRNRYLSCFKVFLGSWHSLSLVNSRTQRRSQKQFQGGAGEDQDQYVYNR